MNISKKQVKVDLARELGQTQDVAEQILDAIDKIYQQYLLDHDSVKFAGVTLGIRHRPSRNFFNMKTGKMGVTAAKNIVTVRVHDSFDEKLNPAS